jgi:hypothetical protein
MDTETSYLVALCDITTTEIETTMCVNHDDLVTLLTGLDISKYKIYNVHPLQAVVELEYRKFIKTFSGELG